MDHSIREKRVDDKKRDISFEFNFLIPGDTPKEINPMLEFEGLEINQPFSQDNLNDPDIASPWLFRPEKDVEVVKNSDLRLGQRGRTFDLTVVIKEFRKRPLIAFLATLLSDETTRSELSQAIVPAINPADIAASQAEREANLTALKIDLSNLIDKAEQAKREYNQAISTPNEEAKKDQWRSAQRAANLKAQEAGIAMPYPEAGFFRTTQLPQ